MVSDLPHQHTTWVNVSLKGGGRGANSPLDILFLLLKGRYVAATAISKHLFWNTPRTMFYIFVVKTITQVTERKMLKMLKLNGTEEAQNVISPKLKKNRDKKLDWDD